jgi:hypothetical protein
MNANEAALLETPLLYLQRMTFTFCAIFLVAGFYYYQPSIRVAVMFDNEIKLFFLLCLQEF